MSTAVKTADEIVLHPLETNAMWQAAVEIADEVYALGVELPEEEKYGMRTQLYMHAYGLTYRIAASLGTTDPRAVEFNMNYVRESLFVLKSTLLLAQRRELLTVSAGLLAKLDDIQKNIDAFLQTALKGVDVLRADEVERYKRSMKMPGTEKSI
jgi:four helix bundle protein